MEPGRPASNQAAPAPWAKHLQPGSSTASPYDYMKAGSAAADRAAALGLTPTRLSDSFGGNQSFPRSQLTSQQLARRLESPCLSRGMAEGAAGAQQLNWSALSGVGGGRGGARLLQSPGKAWAVLSAQGGQVLVCNSVLSSLLGHPEDSLLRTCLWDLVVRREEAREQSCLDQLELDPVSGETVAASGRVVRLRHRDGQLVAVSLTVRRLADSSRSLVLLEPVTRSLGRLSLSLEGLVTGLDQGAEALFQVRESDSLGWPVSRLLPALQLPGGEVGARLRQHTVGELGGEGANCFPVSCLATREEGGVSLLLWVYSALSGLLLLDQEGRVTQGDPAFCSLVLGHGPTGLEGRRIEEIIPGFYEEFEVPSCDKTDDSLGCGQLSPGEEAGEVSPLEELNLNTRSSLPASPLVARQGGAPQGREGGKENSGRETVEQSPVFKRPNSLCVRSPVKIPMEMLTSTPASKGERGLERSRSRQNRSGDVSPLPTGCFYGLAQHSTGAEISVLYQVKRVVLRDGSVVYCVWVTRDSEEVGGKTTLGVSSLGCSLALGEPGEREEPPAVTTLPLQEQYSIESLTAGPYGLKYGTLDQIGQGAFGCVRLAYRLEDRALVVTKFITVAKVAKGGWVEGERGDRLPLEAAMLLGLSHPGIVSVLDVFQTPQFVQLVMEKQGDMDLFEFIDRNPVMDEILSCLIFRQVVSALDYLHTRSILHRDVKDENIIIDHRFSCKLIDFGSAVSFQPGQKFHTFYGTVEYCSPEVLQGCPYDGPQLEMWSVGVLLYIIIFGENPFYDPQDTIRAELHPPHNDVSPSCWELIQALLDKEPSHRASLWHLKEHEWMQQEADPSKYSLYDVIPCSEEELRPPTHYREEGGRLAGRGGETGRPFLSRSSGQGESRDQSLELSSMDSANISSVSSSGVEYSHLVTSLEMDQGQ